MPPQGTRDHVLLLLPGFPKVWANCSVRWRQCLGEKAACLRSILAPRSPVAGEYPSPPVSP